jgi:tetratricopeptide (TPR) repeat protein
LSERRDASESPTKRAWDYLERARAAARGYASTTLFVGIGTAVLVAGASLARLGTAVARAGATALLGVLLLLFGIAWLVAHKRRADALRSVLRETAREQPQLAGEIERAHGLFVSSEVALWDHRADGDVPLRVSAKAELATLHLARKLAGIEVGRIVARASRSATWSTVAALVFAAVATSAAAIEPLRVVEGLDVWVSRGGRAPLTLVYVDDLELTVEAPRHTALGRVPAPSLGDVSAPKGSVLTVRARPLERGRDLVLTDGAASERFVPDGQGAVVARWTVKGAATLRVAARFGEVRIEQADDIEVEAIVDEAPKVTLAGAPETVKLVEKRSLTLSWEATDDYGLTEIALVLRAGEEEERRTISKPHTQTKRERGAFELSTQESFFKRSSVPVEVTIQARDNDGVVGAKWGKSLAFIVIPPIVGEAEAKRHAALLSARDALVDLLAVRLARRRDAWSEPVDKAAVVDADLVDERGASKVVEGVLHLSYGGLRVAGGARRVLAGQLRRLEDAGRLFRENPTKKTFEELVTVTEDVVLAVDSSVRGTANAEASKVATKLSKVAEDARKAAFEASTEGEREHARARLVAAIDVLRPASLELAKLGDLGADLGDLSRAGTERIERTAKVDDFLHAELAAKHLAERLANPTYSIGGGGGRPGVESGGGDGEGVADGEASEAHELAEKGARELEDLIREHQTELERVDKALEEATTQEERDLLKKLAKEQAKVLRDAVSELPQSGPSGSAAEKAAKARQRVESMATKLERGKVKDAIGEGKDALEQLRDTKKRAEAGELLGDEEIARGAVKSSNRVEEAIDALEQAMKAVEEQARDRAKEQLQRSGKAESKLGEKADDLRERGEDGETAIPREQLERLQKAAEAMKRAGRALESGEVEEGLEQQREAQRLLEMSRDPPEDAKDATAEEDNPDSPDRADGSGKESSQDSEVPDAEDHKSPEAFRKRVMDGLSKKRDKRHEDALRRYTEGLLR